MNTTSLDKKINDINRQLITKTSTLQIERNNNVFTGINIFTKPVNKVYKLKPNYTITSIGYKITESITSDVNIESGKETLLGSLRLPCYDVWLISYRLEMNLSLGFSCLRSSKIILNANSFNSQIIVNNNNITPQNQLSMTNTDMIVYEASEDNTILNLFVTFIYGRSVNIGTFTILNNYNLPILTATRIA